MANRKSSRGGRGVLNDLIENNAKKVEKERLSGQTMMLGECNLAVGEKETLGNFGTVDWRSGQNRMTINMTYISNQDGRLYEIPSQPESDAGRNEGTNGRNKNSTQTETRLSANRYWKDAPRRGSVSKEQETPTIDKKNTEKTAELPRSKSCDELEMLVGAGGRDAKNKRPLI